MLIDTIKKEDLVFRGCAKHVVMIPVESAEIAAISYFNSNLTVAFNQGSVLRYNNVPYDKYDGLLTAENREDYLDKNLRRRYLCERIV